MHCRKIFLSLLLLGFLWSAQVAVADETTCLSDEELIALTADEFSTAIPCDFIGAYFLIGLGEESANLLSINNTDVDENYGYYFYFRRYLHGKMQTSSVREDNFAHLLLGLAVAPQPSFPVTKEIDRANYYSSFAIAEYWDEHDQILPETTVVLSDMMLLFNDGGFLRDMKQVRCFVKYDIPTIEPALVIGSELYNSCIDGY